MKRSNYGYLATMTGESMKKVISTTTTIGLANFYSIGINGTDILKCPEMNKPVQKWQRSGKRRMPKPR